MKDGGNIMKREVVEHILIAMGMPVKLKGFKYIVDAVMLLDMPEWKNPKWTALYYKIGVLNNDTESKVERAIRNAFTTTRNKVADYDLIEHYIGFTNCANSNSLIFLYKNIKEEFPEEVPRCPTGTVDLQTFNALSAELIKGIVRQTLKEMFFEMA